MAGPEVVGSDTSSAVAFGPFRLIPERRLLLEGDKPSRISSRAMEILLALVERAGETVSKHELLDRAWPDSLVDEANLRVHVTGLRRALGDGQDGFRYIANVMGRGYCFVAPVSHVASALPGRAAATQKTAQHNLPALLTRILGRDDAIEAVALQVPKRRCVVITGPGGIGKTTVAVAAAEKLLTVYDDGVWFIDLAAIVEPERIPFTIAVALGFSVASAEPVTALTGLLRDKQLLLLLDNCEHVVEGVAPLVEAILRAAPHLSVLATSREALRAEGEWIYRLKPIATPPEADALTAAEAQQFAAVQLFVEHASASLDGFQLTDAEAPAVAQICRNLDGLPGAIELAAARIDMFGLRGLQSVLNEHFLLQAQGLRTVQPRQQSLAGALEWSYRLLPTAEQAILCRLAVFRGDFTLHAAVDIASGDGVSVAQIYGGILTLTAKSLIATDVTVDVPEHRHRLLQVTRAFAAQKLRESGEYSHVVRRLAEYLCRLFIKAEADWEAMEREQWMSVYAHTIADVHAVLDWAFSPEGDAALGVTLTAAALPLGFQLSLIDELRGWVERALLHAGLIVPSQPLAEMRLNIAMPRLEHNQRVPIGGRMPGLERAIELSKQLDSLAHQCEPLIGQSVQYLAVGDYAAAVDLMNEAHAIAEASGDRKAILGVDRVGAQVYHFAGDHAHAQALAKTVLEHPTRLTYNAAPVDRRVAMRIILARIAWMQGLADRAATLADEAIRFAASDAAFALSQALVLAAIPIAIWRGDDAAANAMINTLEEEARRYSLGFWATWVPAFRGELRWRAGELTAPPRLMGTLQLDTFATFSAEYLVPDTVQRADHGQAGWCEAEILRARGEWLLQQGAPGAAEAAEGLFRRALDIARRQGALAWELRAAMSLTRLSQRQAHRQEGRNLLASVVQRFTEGKATQDVKEAATLLAVTPQAAPTRPPARRKVQPRR